MEIMNLLKNNNKSITGLFLSFTVIATIFGLSKIIGCTSENPIIVDSIENHVIIESFYRWEYVFGDSTMEITDVKATDSKINVWWTAYGEINVGDYEIQYQYNEMFKALGRRTGKGTRPDTIEYFFWADFEMADSLMFRIMQTHFDGSSNRLQFITIKL